MSNKPSPLIKSNKTNKPRLFSNVSTNTIFEVNDASQTNVSIQMYDGRNKLLVLNSNEIHETKETLIKYAEEIDILYGRSSSIKSTDIEKHESLERFVKFGSHLRKLLFKEEIEFYNFFKDSHTKCNRINFISETFTLPLELICFDKRNLKLLGESFVVCRKYPVGKPYPDGEIVEDINLSYIPTIGVDLEKKELNLLKSFDINSNKSFSLNILPKIESIERFFEETIKQKSNFLHFSCHMESNEVDEKDSSLIFRDIKLQLVDFEDYREIWMDKILFVNACKSARSKLNKKESICSHFFKTGIKLLISVESEILDDFAIEFSEQFYNRVLNDCKSIQEIINDTANYFWMKKRNPLGFFYHSIGPIINFNCNGRN